MKVGQFNDYLIKQLQQAQKDGYVIPENSDNEVAIWMNAFAHNVTNKAISLLQPKEYVLIDGQLYLKEHIKNNVPPVGKKR